MDRLFSTGIERRHNLTNTEELPQTTRAVRFGTFELDLAAGELRKNGLKVRLQDQPFQLLASLATRPGEVVTRVSSGIIEAVPIRRPIRRFRSPIRLRFGPSDIPPPRSQDQAGLPSVPQRPGSQVAVRIS